MAASIIYFPEIEGLKQETFLSSDTFVVPENVTKVMVLAVGGGSGAGFDRNTGLGDVSSGGQGGFIVFTPMNVSSGETLSITVGNGGAAGTASVAGGAGQNSIVSGSLQIVTAKGAPPSSTRGFSSPNVSSLGGYINSGFANVAAEDSIYAFGGAIGGGGASYGNGASAGNSAAANTGAGGGYTISPDAFGSGGSGRVHIYYASNN